LKERKPKHSTTTSPLPRHQSHQLKTHIEPVTPRDMLSLELVTSPLRKKSKTTFESLVNDSKKDEEQTYLGEIGGGRG
jgi:hypothetical protein